MNNLNDWPWPRIFPTRFHNFYVHRFVNFNELVVSKLELSTGADIGRWIVFPLVSLNAFPGFHQIDFADFGPFYGFSCIRSPYTGLQLYTAFRDLSQAEGNTGSFITIANPQIGTMTNFNNSLFGGNIRGNNAPWDDHRYASVIWSGAGNFEFDPAKDMTAGFSHLPFEYAGHALPIVFKVKKLSNSVIVYSNSGKVKMSPETVDGYFTYSQLPLDGYGVNSGDHVAGDDYLHGYIDIVGDFNVIDHNGKVERRGYREFIKPIINSTNKTVISYQKRDKRFYISNGERCLVINQYGAYHIHQMVSSLIETYEGTLVGTFFDTNDRRGLITSDTLTFGSRGVKSIESILGEVDQSHLEATRPSYAVDWRNATNEQWRSSQWKTGGPSSQAGIHVAATEFRAKFAVEEYSHFNTLQRMLINVKFSEQRFKRGTVPAQYDTREGTIT